MKIPQQKEILFKALKEETSRESQIKVAIMAPKP